MMSESGNKPVNSAGNRSESWNSDSATTTKEAIARIALGSSEITFTDMIQMHLVDCVQCQNAIMNLRPRANGQKTGLCDTYLHLQILLAQEEGRVNNIVAHTELGDEAPKGRPLE